MAIIVSKAIIPDSMGLDWICSAAPIGPDTRGFSMMSWVTALRSPGGIVTSCDFVLYPKAET